MAGEFDPRESKIKDAGGPISTDTKTTQDSETKQKPWISDLFMKKLSIKVKKPLIPLKLALFFYFGAGASIYPFIQVFLKQKGLTIAQISFIYMLNPCVQFLGPVLSGIVADKIGRAKPVLLGNLFLSVVFFSSMIFIPNITVSSCEKNMVKLACNPSLVVIKGSEICNTTVQAQCKKQCRFDDAHNACNNANGTLCNLISNNANATIDDIILLMNLSSKKESNFSCHADSVISNKKSFNWCEILESRNCNLSCHLKPTSENDPLSCGGDMYDNSTLVFWLSLVLLISMHTVASTAYRMFDFTVMTMVKTHNSDFGRERFWSITGVLIFSIISGYAIGKTTKEGSLKNYDVAIYIFDAVAVLSMIAVCKLDVQIQPPGQQMFKKTLSLLKKPDIAVFSATVLILGTCWCFSKQYFGLYLDNLGAPSFLLGLNAALNSLFGLPFLLTSNFFVDKIGSGNLLVSGLIGHTIFFIGYAYLVNPWWSLALELTGILNYHLLWVAVIRHSYTIAPEGLTATVISTAGALHYAIGKGTGSMIGGLTMSKYGGRSAFKLMAVISGCTAILYAFYLFSRHLCSKKRFQTSSNASDKMETASYFKTEAAVYAINVLPPLSNK